MKKLIASGFVAVVSATAAFGQGYGRGVYKPGEATVPEQGPVRHGQYDRTPKIDRRDYNRAPGGAGHLDMAPISLTVLNWGMPYGRNWAICGLRLNLGIPWITHQYASVYGIDAGLSGETFSETGGIMVNAFNNTTRDMYGIAVGGLWNRSLGVDSAALQVAMFLNSAEGLDGVQIGLVNRAHGFHGVQIGLYNIAVHGGGLQIGLWNDCGPGRASPIIGIVY